MSTGSDVPPRGLAVASWGTPASLRLDLRYLPDEADWLDPPPARVWEEVVASAPHHGADLAASYPVDDAYGGARGAEAVGRHFGIDLAPHQVSFGAGVTALLHGLADLASRGSVVAPELTHPDLEAWATARGASVEPVPGSLTADRLIAAVERLRPALVHFDRPAFGNEVLELADVERVAAAAAAANAAVVVDEAAAPYLRADQSAVRLVPRAANLVVLRGFTKAYSLGGLRVGIAVASPAAAARVRAAIPPLQVGGPAFAVALRLLAAGDVFERLRARIRATKPRSVALLEAAGLVVRPGHPDVPAAVVDDAGGRATRLLGELGVCGLHPPARARPPFGGAAVLHLRTPIDDDRIELLRRLLAESVSVRGVPGKRSGRTSRRSGPAPSRAPSRPRR